MEDFTNVFCCIFLDAIQMIDLEMDQQRQGYFHPEPCIIMTGAASFSQPNVHTVVAAPGNSTSVDSQYVPEHFDNPMMYGMPQYNGIQNQHNIDLGFAPAANLYYSGRTPSSSTGMLSVPMNHRALDQLPSSSTYAAFSSENFGRSSHYMDDIRGQFKRKNAEGITGTFQHFNASASSSSSVAPPNTRHLDGIAVMDSVSYSLPHSRGTVTPSLMEVGPQSSVWNRSGDSVMLHDHTHMIQGNYMGQHFQPAATPWLDQQLSSNNSDGRTPAWNQSLAMPYIQASNVNGGSLETGSMGVQRHHETASHRTGPRFLHPPLNQLLPSYHHATMPMQGARGHNINFHSHINTPSFRVPTNPSCNIVVPAQNGFEMGPRHLGPALPTGVRMYHPPRRVVTETTFGHRNLPHMRILPADEVAILEMPDFYEVGNFVDHHRDMRLDIEDMSYEELLALGERIGNVSTGLTEEIIINKLRTKTYLTPATAIKLEEAACEDQEADSCIICQDEYNNQEKIGVLKCGHEYHADCLRKWLLVKNVCPICKSEALSTGRKGV
ncbi:RING/U-box superfamily protein [Quillaja saponaria]|uniref:RING-type E3 ubiquitin transferase n=1 Tax=Quillaja saponaria TaxID=32244 RepID=A0AAD7L0Q6_QUISA|nr:RING/U-box superfamily protein [Quillaja saponaria]